MDPVLNAPERQTAGESAAHVAFVGPSPVLPNSSLQKRGAAFAEFYGA